MRIFLDANVVFSAANDKSALRDFLFYLRPQATFVTSPYAYTEASRNIDRKRPDWNTGLQTLLKIITMVADHPLHSHVKLADKDRPILGAAIAARCIYLLTGDKRDFGSLYGKTIDGVTIVSYPMLAEKLV